MFHQSLIFLPRFDPILPSSAVLQSLALQGPVKPRISMGWEHLINKKRHTRWDCCSDCGRRKLLPKGLANNPTADFTLPECWWIYSQTSPRTAFMVFKPKISTEQSKWCKHDVDCPAIRPVKLLLFSHRDGSFYTFDIFRLYKSYQKGGTTPIQNSISQQGRCNFVCFWQTLFFSSLLSSPLLPESCATGKKR